MGPLRLWIARTERRLALDIAYCKLVELHANVSYVAWDVCIGGIVS